MQSTAGAQVLQFHSHLHSHLHSRSYRSQPLMTHGTSSITSSPPSSRSSSPPPSNTSTFYSDDLPEHKATNPSHQHHGHAKDTASVLPSIRQELSSLSRSIQGGRPRKRRKTYSSRSSSLDRGSNIYRHWTSKSFKPSLAINVRTDPNEIKLLWQSVMMAPSGRDLRSGRGSKRGQGKNSKGNSVGDVENPPKGQGSVSEPTYFQSSNEMPSAPIKQTSKASETSNKRNTPSNADSKRNSPYSSDFVQKVLDPRSIKIFDADEATDTAYGHFGIEELETRDVAAIDRKKKLPESSIWIDTSDTFVNRVAKRYTDMRSHSLCEAEFATYAKEKLLKRDDFADDRETDDREWRAERFVELVTKPESTGTWVAPPIIENLESTTLSSSSDFSFDVRPDCSYWLGMKAFSQTYRDDVPRWIHTIYDEFISPYLTVEFKRDLDAEFVSKNQVAAASSLALHNRFRLREKRFSVMQKPWTKEDIMDIKHYGMTMQGYKYKIWCITPTLSEADKWAGCEVKVVGCGKCNKPYGVRRFIDWINEIHYWGLTVHGPHCQDDAKYILSKTSKGIRPSDIGAEGKGKDKKIA